MDFSEELLSEMPDEEIYGEEFSSAMRSVGRKTLGAGLYWELARNIFETWMMIFKARKALSRDDLEEKKDEVEAVLAGYEARLEHQVLFFWEACDTCGVEAISKRWLMLNADTEININLYRSLCEDRQAEAGDVVSLTKFTVTTELE